MMVMMGMMVMMALVMVMVMMLVLVLLLEEVMKKKKSWTISPESTSAAMEHKS